MKKSQEALRPNLYETIKKIYNRPLFERAKENGATEDEQYLHDLANTRGWKVLKEHIEALIKHLDLKMLEGVEAGLAREEIGERAVVLVLSKGLLESIVNKVEDAKEAVQDLINEKV